MGEGGQLEATVGEWEPIDRGDPYTGNDDLTADIETVIQAAVSINEIDRTFDIWHLTGTTPGNYGCCYVVRATLDTGRKSKNPIPSTDGLFVRSRGTPWTGEKQWTKLSRQELERRSELAGLGPAEPAEDRDNDHVLHLGIEERPLVADGALDTELVAVLAKMLVVMQAGSNPA